MASNNAIIYIMRHGRTEWNVHGKLQGRLNSPLLSESIEDLHRMGRLLGEYSIEAIYSSPLERCRLSAGIISEMIGLSAIYLDDLAECDHGLCEGLSLDQAKKEFADFFYERETSDKWHIKWPGGEAYADVAIRAGLAIQAMDLTKPTLIIAHETVNKVLAGLLLNLSHDEIMQRKQKNNEVFCIDLVGLSLQTLHC